MATEGVFGFVYCGANGIGVGCFTVRDGVLEGTDSGFRYTGTVKEQADGWLDVDMSFVVPPGHVMVQGTSPQELPHTRFIKQKLPPMFGDGKPLEIKSGPGGVTVMIKRIPDEWAAAAKGFRIEIP